MHATAALKKRRYGRSQIPGVLPEQQRTRRLIAVSDEMVAFLKNAKGAPKEATEDTLRRLIGLAPRKGE
jgi:hypothetical protein